MTSPTEPPSPGGHVSVGGPQYDFNIPHNVPQVFLPKSQFRRIREKLLHGLAQELDFFVGAGFTLIGFGLASAVGAAVQWAALPAPTQVFLATATIVGIVVGTALLVLSRRARGTEIQFVGMALEEMDDVAEEQGEDRVLVRHPARTKK